MSISKLRKKMRSWVAKVIWGGLVVIFVAGAFVGFGRMGSSGRGERAAGGDTAPKNVAKVNGEEVPRARYDAVLAQELRFAQYMGGGDSVTQIEQTKQRALDQAVELVLKQQAAKRERVRVRGRDIDDKIEDYVKQELRQSQMSASSPKLFERQLRKEYGSLDRYKSKIRADISRDKVQEQVLLDKLEKKIKDRIHVSENDYRESTVRIKARLIMVKPSRVTPPTPSKGGKGKAGGPSEAERDAAARKKAEDLLKQIKAGADFAQVAKQNSDDFTTAPKGGDLGEISLGQKSFYYGDQFDQVAFKLNPGQVSNVFKGADAYYVVRVESRKYNIPKDFEDVNYKCLNTSCKNEWTAKPGAKTCPKCKQDKIVQVGVKKKDYIKQLETQRQDEAWRKYTQELKDKAKIDVLDPELQASRKQMEGKAKEAAKLYEEALKYADGQDPFVKSSPIHYNLALLYRQENKIAEAISQINEALRVDETAPLRVELAKLLRDQGKKKDAVEQLKLAVPLAEREPTLHGELAFLLKDLGEKKLAAEEEKKARQNRGGGFNFMPRGF